jgi:hypothetical protein
MAQYKTSIIKLLNMITNLSDINLKVFDGIRKTINRFREKPFHYFTEADIHSSLLNDIMIGGSDILTIRPNGNPKHITVSIVHQEYPTNFRYKKEALLNGYSGDDLLKTAPDFIDDDDKTYGDRGNYDLAILNRNFLVDMLQLHSLPDALENIINKDNSRTKKRLQNYPGFKEEVLYAIEVKFIHSFNARQINMLHEVIKDDQKLRMAHYHSDGFIRPINLVFCSSPAKASRGGIKAVIDHIKEYVQTRHATDRGNQGYRHPQEVATIFIESFIDIDDKKRTERPMARIPNLEWAEKLVETLNAHSSTIPV